MNILLSFAWLALTVLRMLFMVLALLVVVPAGWLEALTEWIDRKRNQRFANEHDWDSGCFSLGTCTKCGASEADDPDPRCRPRAPVAISVKQCGRCGQTPGVCECP